MELRAKLLPRAPPFDYFAGQDVDGRGNSLIPCTRLTPTSG
jgi:hypothetical protein